MNDRRWSGGSLNGRRACGLIAFAVLGCGGGAERSEQSAGTPASGPAQVRLEASEVTPRMIALGDSVYHGLIGVASCQSCHGPQATGTSIGPNLTDGAWLHSDGSLQGILTTIQAGVMTPKEFTSIMPPYGGIPLPPEHARAVAAYVHARGGGR